MRNPELERHFRNTHLASILGQTTEKNEFGTLKNPPSPFFPHITRIIGVVFIGGGQRVRAQLE